MRQFVFSLALVLLSISACPAVAQSPRGAGGEAADREARSLFQAGEQAFTAGHFDRALEYFQRAFELSDRPALLFNIGNCHDRLRHNEEAIDAFQRYTVRVPEAPNRQFAETRIAALQAEMEAGDENPSSPGPDPDEGASSTAETPGPESSGGEHDGGSGGVNLPGVILTAVGGAALAAGIGTTFWAIDRADAVDFCPMVSCSNLSTLTEERDTAILTTGVLIGAGVLMLGVGIVLIVLDPGADDESASLECGPNLTGLTCRGQF